MFALVLVFVKAEVRIKWKSVITLTARNGQVFIRLSITLGIAGPQKF